ncbi:terminase small subunit [Endozoicomonas lisbonensis]|uniref:Phage terminase Nu1 subunit (DNA packaging protein) n=1 Tax=Endozoicomonas lisbonensis TaxID=3120522 RepID=A0ABV2SFJ9_9GAMM
MSRKKQPQPEAHWLNKTNMAASLGVSVQAFEKWGVPPLGKFGRSVYFDVRSVLENRLAHEVSKQQPTSIEDLDENSIEFERYRLTKAQADGQELKNELARGEVAPVELQSFVLGRCLAEAAGILDTLLLNMKRKHPELTPVQLENFKREIVKSQNAISRGNELIPQYLDEYLSETAAESV